MPRKLKKPVTSVIVVRTMEEDWAGSCPITVSMIGIAAPATPAMIIESTIDAAMIRARPQEPLHTSTPTEVVSATTTPFQKPTFVSLNTTRGHCATRISRSARPRMVTARAWAPVLPDCPATTGREGRKRGELGDGVLEESDHRRGDERGDEVDLKPGQTLAHREGDRRRRALVLAHPHHGLNADARALLLGLDHRGVADHPDQPAVEVEHRQIRQAVLFHLLSHFLASRHRIDDGSDVLDEIAHKLVMLGEREVLHVHPAGEMVVGIHHEETRPAGPAILAQPLEHLGDGAVLAEQSCPGVHRGAGGSVRLDPGASGRGLSLTIAPVWGTPSSGVDRLWSARDAAVLCPFAGRCYPSAVISLPATPASKS